MSHLGHPPLWGKFWEFFHCLNICHDGISRGVVEGGVRSRVTPGMLTGKDLAWLGAVFVWFGGGSKVLPEPHHHGA
jgi:hypothetical protein